MDKIIRIVTAVFAVIIVASVAVLFSGAPAQKDTATTIYFFYGEECPHCHNVIPFINNMTENYPEADIRILEIWHNQTNQQLYQQALSGAGVSQTGVPVVISGKTVIIGERDIPAKLEALIQDILKKKA